MNEFEENIKVIQDQMNRRSVKPFLKLHGTLSKIKNFRQSPQTVANNVYDAVFYTIENLKKIYDRDCPDLAPDISDISELPSNSLFSNIIQQVFEQQRLLGKKIVCFMAPIFTSENIIDGYYRRIKAVDDIFADDFYCVYISPFGYNYETKIITHKQIDENHLSISYDMHDEVQQNIIRKVGDMCDVLYHHSVGYINWLILKNPNIIKIVDLHGALPEELQMYELYERSQTEKENEKIAANNVDYFVCVTEEMSNHMKNKYPQSKAKHIIMPILEEKIVFLSQNKPSINSAISEKPVVTYAGGLQKWQMIDRMQEIIWKTQDKYEYRIFVPSPDDFYDMWTYAESPNFNVESKQIEELLKEYYNCQYGFILREESVVNSVACPTKLVEYLATGIIPIMNTVKLGDFVQDGMKYISMEDFVAGNLPPEHERQLLVESNKKVLARMVEKFIDGKASIHSIVQKGKI
jgi:hypothetical protein